MRHRELWDERGSSTVLAVGLIVAMLSVTLAASAVLSAVRSAHVARSAADLAALAAAIQLQESPDPRGACGEAARVATRHDARVLSCDVGTSGVVTVTVATSIPLRLAGVGPDHAEGRARAGPG
ncbi:hypothetical protein ASG73_17140 [Janibacter sp. Soil728]|uniref:Rv3654c family TadE-like protein n=1 Tax=Janibacter sp. Soil728 TaxID=1736393 RepID=UPI0006F9E7EC|nr:Rv3654c family TadE-like protein [Janibacter sp. Soil728]KRE35065.1 hypothetical protein ASG73_17140 [Janibacter sp. Soil728]